MKRILILITFTLFSVVLLTAQKTKPVVNANSFFKKGLALHQKNDVKNAILYYSEALERDKSHSEALYNRAMAYFSQKKYLKCVNDLNDFLAMHPQDRDALERRGNAALLLENYEDAVTFYTRAIQIASSARLLNNRGIAQLESNNPEIALKDFQESHKKDPEFIEAMIGIGNAFFALGEYDNAYKQYNEAVKKGSKDKRLVFNLAITNSKKKAYQAAIVQFTQLLSTQDNAEALAQRAFCHYKIGQMADAMQDATHANQLDIRNAFAYNILALLYLEKGDTVKAELTYSEGLSWESSQPELLAGRGYAYYKQKKYTLALDDLNAAIALSPNLGAAYYTRASVHLMLEQRLEACNDYKKALTIGYEPFTEEESSSFCEGIANDMETKQ
jgi:tetratricopeptide (TPR) repeat protein